MPIVKLRNPQTGEIIEAWDDDPSTTESQATISERFRAGLAPEKTRIKEWEHMLGAGNVRQTDTGEIEIRKGGKWGPVEGPTNWSLTELAGDVADYGGELIEDIGAGVGAAIGAAKGTAVLPGVGTVAGLSAGGGVGRAIGSGARQAAAGALGVNGFEGERLGEIGSSALEGAIVEPIGFGVGKAVSQGAKAAAPYLKEIAGSAGRKVTQLATGVSEKGTKALYDNPKLVREIAKDPIGYADKTLDKLRNDVVVAKKEAGSKLGELTQQIFTRNDPINNLSAVQRIDDILAKYNVTFDANGNPIADYATIQNDAEIGKLLDIRNKIAKAPSVFDARSMRQGLDDIVYINGQDVSTNFKAARTDIRRVIEDAIEEAAQAKGPDVGEAYKALKDEYTKAATNYDFIDDIFEVPQPGTKASKILAEEKRGLSRVRNLQGEANSPYVEGLLQFAAENPQFADDIEGLLTVAAGNEWSQFIPPGKMDVTRGMQGLIAGGAAYFDPIAAGTAYVATRPKVAKTYLPEIGKASQAAIGSIEGLATPIGEQVSREATRALTPIGERTGLSPNEIESEIQSRAPELVDYARNRYGANFKRATDAGADDVTAAFTVIRDQLGKGNTKVVEAFGDLQERSGTDGKRFADTTYTILQRYTGAQ